MDTVTSVKCSYHEGGLSFQEESIPLDTRALLELLEKGLRSTCFLVGLGDAKRLETHFRDSDELPLKVRDKHASKPLADYLLLHVTQQEERRILLVRGFKKPGQLERSIRIVLSKFVGATTFIPVLAVDDALFEQFRTRTNTGRKEQGARTAGGADTCSLKKSRAEFDEKILDALKEQLTTTPVPDSLKRAYVGTSTIADIIRHQICIAAGSTAPVLILGDMGTGKEVVAQQIHQQSARREKEFVTVNCSAIGSDLLESELFGHKKGAFTGAVADRVGLWTTAAGGTIFLDEIGEMDLRHQAKILRVLEDGTFKPIGDNRLHRSDARVVAATNRNLTDMIRAGRFREDLYFRLGGSLIRTSPLRDHPEDIPAIAQHFWRNLTRNGDDALPASVATELERHAWTGNARELRALVVQLHGLTRDGRPSLEKLRLAFYLNGQDLAVDAARTASEDSFSQKAEFLRHLKNTADIVQTAKAFAANLSANNHEAAGPGPSPRENLDAQVHRLEELARNCLLFHSRSAYDAVLDLKEKLRHFLGLRTQSAAAEYRRKTLIREFERCISALFDEVGAIVGA